MHPGRVKILCVLTYAFACCLLGALEAHAQLNVISIVVDGDRIVLSDGTRIQLKGIDAPEKHISAKLEEDAARAGRSKDIEMRLGEISAAYLTAIGLGHSVIVEYEGPAAEWRPGGPYVPAIVYVTDERGKAIYSLNEKLLEDGYAYHAPLPSFSLNSRYAQLARTAKATKLGLWAEPDVFGAASRPVGRSSEGMDLNSTCRTDSACQWVSQSVGGVGFWQSKPGRRCPCAE